MLIRQPQHSLFRFGSQNRIMWQNDASEKIKTLSQFTNRNFLRMQK